MWAVSFKVSIAINCLFAILAVVFFTLGAGEAANSQTVIRIGAGIGILLALNGWYVSAAIVANRTVGRLILPLGSKSAH
jgi:succinate-acetate transporter protein